MSSLSQAADHLEVQAELLLESCLDRIYAEVHSFNCNLMPLEETEHILRTGLAAIIAQLRSGEFEPVTPETMAEKLFQSEESALRVRGYWSQLDLLDFFHGLKIFKDAIWDSLKQRFASLTIHCDGLFEIERRINTMLHVYTLLGTSSSIRSREELIQSHRTEMLKWDEVIKSASNIELKIPCREEFAVIGRMQAEAIARRLKYDEEEVQDIKSAVGEAVDNAIEHGNSEKGIDLHYHLSMDDLLIEIIDYGCGFDLDEKGAVPPDPMAERGRGIFLMRNLLDNVSINSKSGEGTQVIMRKKRIFR